MKAVIAFLACLYSQKQLKTKIFIKNWHNSYSKVRTQKTYLKTKLIF